MGLVGPWLSNTSTTKKKEKITKKKQEDLERGWRERNVRLKEMHLPKETFEQYLEWIYGTGSKTKTKTDQRVLPTTSGKEKATNITKVDAGSIRESKEKHSEIEKKTAAHWVKGPCSTKPSPVYTGTKMIGIAQMHKSNAVPVFSDEEVKDISKMRR